MNKITHHLKSIHRQVVDRLGGPKVKLSVSEQSVFARRLAMLIKADVPILQALGMLKEQAHSPGNIRMIEQIIQDTANGQALWKSFGKYKKVFGDFAVNIIKVGETSGTLHSNLQHLSEELEKKQELRRKMTSAMVYPVTIIIASFGISGLLTVYLFPKLLPVFKSLNVPLPLSTRTLIFISDFLIHYGFFVFLAAIAFAIATPFVVRKPRVRYQIDKMSLKIPYMGTLLRNYQLSNICRTLGLLLRGHVTVREATSVAADTASNVLYREDLHLLVESITRGATISSHLEKTPRLFPSLMSQMVLIGEKTGNLSDTLLFLADHYEKEFDEQNKRFSSILEPLLMLIMGGMVAFIAVSIITPIYEVTQHLQPK